MTVTTPLPDFDLAPCQDAVVVGVDGSENSLTSLRWAATFAEAVAARLHVITNRAANDPEHADILALADQVGATVDHTSGLLRTAMKQASESARMIVLPMRGAQAPRAQLLDVIADEVLLHANAPVALLPETSFAGLGSPVVVGVDPDEVDRAALDVAIQTAASTQAPLVLVMAHEPGEQPDTRVQAIAADARQLHPQLSVDIVTSPWTPADALAATSREAAVVVVGSRGGGGLRTPRSGSQSRRLLRLSACPVIVVP